MRLDTVPWIARGASEATFQSPTRKLSRSTSREHRSELKHAWLTF